MHVPSPPHYPQVVVRGGILAAIWTAAEVKVTTPAAKTAIGNVPFQSSAMNVTQQAAFNAKDLDVESNLVLWVAGTPGLMRAARTADTQPRFATYNAYGQVGALNFVAVSSDRTTVWAADRTRVFGFDIATRSWHNSGQPIISLNDGSEFRGLSGAPFSVTPTPTASVTPSSTATATLSGGASASITSSSSATGSITATPSATPTGTVTSKGGALPAAGFTVVVIGNGSMALPNSVNDIGVQVAVEVYESLTASAPLNRRITMPRFDGDGFYRELGMILNSGARYTNNQGRLVKSGDGSMLTLHGYRGNVTHNFQIPRNGWKLEPITFTLRQTGNYDIWQGCKVREIDSEDGGPQCIRLPVHFYPYAYRHPSYRTPLFPCSNHAEQQSVVPEHRE